MSEEETFSGNNEMNRGVTGNGSAQGLIDALRPYARDDLMRHGIAELVSVSVEAVPDPDRPDDHLAMKISAYVGDNFREGIALIDRDLDRVDEIASSSEGDLALVLRDELLVELDFAAQGTCRFAGRTAGKKSARVHERPDSCRNDTAVS